MKELITALVRAKSAFKPVVKDKKGARGFYATLDSVHGAIDSALLDNGLVLMQPMTSVDGKHVLQTVIWHVSGQSIESDYYPIADNADPQKIGAAITYARRYQLCAMLGITADEDTDAENYSKPKPSAPVNEFTAQTKDIIRYALENGVSVDAVKTACRSENLPVKADDYKTQAQVTTLSALVEELIAAVENG